MVESYCEVGARDRAEGSRNDLPRPFQRDNVSEAVVAIRRCERQVRVRWWCFARACRSGRRLPVRERWLGRWSGVNGADPFFVAVRDKIALRQPAVKLHEPQSHCGQFESAGAPR